MTLVAKKPTFAGIYIFIYIILIVKSIPILESIYFVRIYSLSLLFTHTNTKLYINMKHLIEVAKIITKKKIKKIEIFDDHTLMDTQSKFNEFYEALMTGKLKTDNEAAKYLYDSTPLDERYRQLKSRFRRRLLNTLFFLDVNLPATSTYDQAYYTCNKNWTLVKILQVNRANGAAASLASQIITTALNYRFADLIVNCSRILREDAANNGEDKEYEIYDHYIKEYATILDAEIKSEELYQRVFLNYNTPLPRNTDFIEHLYTYCTALDSLSKQYDAPIVHYNKYLVWIYRHEITANYQKMLTVCAEAEMYIEKNPIYYQSEKVHTIYLKKITAYLHLRTNLEGLKLFEKYEPSFNKDSEAWYKFQEYCFLYAMHSKSYTQALSIYNQVLNLPGFKRADEALHEKWNLFQAYLNYCLQYHHTEKSTSKEPMAKRFKTNKLLTQPLLFSKEQKVYIIHLAIAQILYCIEEKNFRRIKDLAHILGAHLNKTFRKDEYFRSIQIIRLLQQLAKAEFIVDDLSNTEKYYKRLTEDNPFVYKGLLQELEIIPYENIWEMALERVSVKHP